MAFGVILYSSWNLVPLIFLFILHSQQLGPPGVAHLGSTGDMEKMPKKYHLDNL